MKILLLGANGQLGMDLQQVGGESFRTFEFIPLTRRELDVSDLPSISRVLSEYAFDVLINCTGYHKTDEVESHASQAFLVNAFAIRLMAQACKTASTRFVHVSTYYVFDGDHDHPYTESDHACPANVYGVSKLYGETLARREYGDSTIVARVASLFGVAGASGKGGNFVETMLRIATEKGELRVVDDIRMSPTWTADAARMILSLIQNTAAPGIYHVVNSGQASWFEFATEIVRQAGLSARMTPLTADQFPTPAIRPAFSVLDNSKTAAICGEIPHWRDALEGYLRRKGHLVLTP